MKIVKIKGGLGNQMFQYAFAKALQSECDDVVKIDMSWVENYCAQIQPISKIINFNLSLPIASKEDLKSICLINHPNANGINYKLRIILEIIFNRKYYFEKNMLPQNMVLLNKYNYFDGYWQAWKYVDLIYDKLKSDFVSKCNISNKTLETIEKVKKENSVFVGVRRGNYIKYSSTYGTFKTEYYINGMEYIEKHVPNPIYYIFSNDIDWVEQNMDFGDRKIVYRRNEDIVDDFEELILMSNCKHSIIQNSTFHWWGARLNYYDGKIVVAPEKWFYDGTQIDIVPPEWVKIENPQ